MDRETYLTAIRDGYAGEIYAAASLGARCDHVGEAGEQYHALRTLQRLEVHCAAVMEPVLRRNGIPVPDAAEIRASAAAGPTDRTWATQMAALREMMPAYVTLYDAVAEQADAPDREALAMFAEHERLIHALSLAASPEEEAQRLRAIDDFIAAGSKAASS